MKAVKEVNSEATHHKQKKKVSFFFSFSFYLYEMMDVNQTYCGNHFTVYVS